MTTSDDCRWGQGESRVFKFIHCADLHIDSPLWGLSEKTDAPVEELRLATRRAFDNLVETALSEKVDFVVIAGDVFDGDWPDYSTGLFLNARLAALGQAGIRVAMVSGNHDAESQISRRLTLPPNAKLLSTARPETMVWDDLGVAIHGQGFPERDVRENLVPAYPHPRPGYFNIGLLHCSVDGLGGHETYAPCKLDDLITKGYDYWALGHIHKHQVLHIRPYVVYSGNLQGRHIRETGAKGAVLVTVDDHNAAVQFRELDVIRWELAMVDLSEVDKPRDFADRVAAAIESVAVKHPHMPMMVRIELVGATALHGELMANPESWRSEAENIAGTRAPGRIWIEDVKFRTTSPPRRRTPLQEDALTELFGTIERVSADQEFLDTFLADVKRYQGQIGSDAVHQREAVRLNNVGDVKAMLPDAQALLYHIIHQGGSSR